MEHKYAMSRPEQWVENKFIEQYEQSLIHLAKLFLYPDMVQEHNHWKQEVWACCHKTYKLTGDNKWPDSTKIWYWYASAYRDRLEHVLHDASWEIEGVQSYGERANEFLTLADGYSAFAADSLSYRGEIMSDEAYSTIDLFLRR